MFRKTAFRENSQSFQRSLKKCFIIVHYLKKFLKSFESIFLFLEFPFLSAHGTKLLSLLLIKEKEY